MGDVDLRLGRWQDVLADIERVDALICDPPYSERTHVGYRHGSDPDDDTGVTYGHITKDDAEEIALAWAPRVSGFAVIFCDHVAWLWHEAAWSRRGWYTFAPVIWVKRGAPPRLSGDGPASQVDHILVARPRRGFPSGSRPGWYLVDTPRAGCGHQGVVGNKDPVGMRAVVRDYTLPGDLVCDPFSGSGTTARACMLEGRRFIGAEQDPDTHALAMDRLRGLGPTGKPQLSFFDQAATSTALFEEPKEY